MALNSLSCVEVPMLRNCSLTH